MGRIPPGSANLFLALVALVAVFGLIGVYLLRRDVAEESRVVTDADLLRDFERAYYAGEMDEAEFKRVSARLRGRGPAPPSMPPPSAPIPGPEGVVGEGYDGDDDRPA